MNATDTPEFQKMRYKIRETAHLVSMYTEIIELGRQDVVKILQKEKTTPEDCAKVMGWLRHMQVNAKKLEEHSQKLNDMLKEVIVYLENNE